MSVTSSHSSDFSITSNIFLFGSSLDYSTDSLPTTFAFPEISPPKSQKRADIIQEAQQQNHHTTFFSKLGLYDIKLAMERGVCNAPLGFRPAVKGEYCNSGHCVFYTTVIERGIGLPLHHFFIEILNFYNLAPAQVSPVAWCHMLGTLLIYRKLKMGVPALVEWRSFYKLQNSPDNLGMYFFTNWPGGEALLITKTPNNIGEWKICFFWLAIDHGSYSLRREFGEPRGFPPMFFFVFNLIFLAKLIISPISLTALEAFEQPTITGADTANITKAYNLEDTTLKNINKIPYGISAKAFRALKTTSEAQEIIKKIQLNPANHSNLKRTSSAKAAITTAAK